MDSCIAHFRLALLVALGAAPCAWAAAPVGCEVGAVVPSFFVREVTGPRPNRAICLVCRYGARPCVLVSVRGLDEQVKTLLERVDRVVDRRRGVGLRGFAIFLDADRRVQPQLFTLARQRKLSLPLAFPVESGGPRTLDLPKGEGVTVLLYRKGRIVRRFIHSPQELTEKSIDKIARAAEEFGESAE